MSIRNCRKSNYEYLFSIALYRNLISINWILNFTIFDFFLFNRLFCFKLNSLSIQFYILLLRSKFVHYSKDSWSCFVWNKKRKRSTFFSSYFLSLYVTTTSLRWIDQRRTDLQLIIRVTNYSAPKWPTNAIFSFWKNYSFVVFGIYALHNWEQALI